MPKLIIGLGNPGSQYALTRHNLGFMLIDKLAQAHFVSIHKKKFQALGAEFTLRGEKIILLKPQTFMNNSGAAAHAALDFYKLAAPDLLALHDDLDQDFGAVRLRVKGSSGGHNGLKSIIACLGQENFARVKMGIGRPAPLPQGNPAGKNRVLDYVLGKFTEAEQERLPEILDKGLELINKWLSNPS